MRKTLVRSCIERREKMPVASLERIKGILFIDHLYIHTRYMFKFFTSIADKSRKREYDILPE